jgi:hypothetical protein
MSRHRVRAHHWRSGNLAVIDYWFESFEEANRFALSENDAHSIKIYNEDSELVDKITPQPSTDTGNTYA